VAPCYKMGFSDESYHFDIKYHMAFDIFVTYRDIVHEFEGRHQVMHFLVNCVSPISSTSAAVDFQGLFHCLG
jgi:hypothetical protein